jgi:hypothetical protein
MRPWAYAPGLTWVRAGVAAQAETGAIQPGNAAVKDTITPKVFVVLVTIAAIGFAVWSGLRTSVETLGADATPRSAFTTPF